MPDEVSTSQIVPQPCSCRARWWPGWSPARSPHPRRGPPRAASRPHLRRGAGGLPRTTYLPLLTGAYYSVANIEQFQRLSYRSLFWIGDQGQASRQPAAQPGQTPDLCGQQHASSTSTLGKWNWSDGTPVTSRDVAFWINLLEANKKNIAFYIPGEFPDNLKSYKITGPESIQLSLSGPVNPTWFTYDQLSQITPIPTADLGQDVGFGRDWQLRPDTLRRRAGVQLPDRPVKRHRHLRHKPSYGRRLTARGSSINTSPTATYSSRPTRPIRDPTAHAIEYFVEQPFTTRHGRAQCACARATRIDYGYFPFEDEAQQSGALESQGYTQTVWNDWGITYFVFNFHNPTVGPIFCQAYFRQAMQSLIDERSFIKGPLNGFAVTDYGPVPAYRPRLPRPSRSSAHGRTTPPRR